MVGTRTGKRRAGGRGLAYLPFWLLLGFLVVGCGTREATDAVATVALIAPSPTVAPPPPTNRPPTATVPATNTPAPTPQPTPTATATARVTSVARTPAPTPSRTTAATGTGPAVQISIVDFAFVPPAVTVKTGTTVVWQLDVGYHTVLSDDRLLDSPILENVGDRYSVTLTQPGFHSYVCGIHPDMLATVQVVP